MLLALSVGLFFGWKGMAAAPAADGTPSAETFVCQRDGSLTVIPDSLIVRRDTIVGQVRFHLAPPSANAANTALIKSFAQNSIVSITKTRPADMDFPAFTSFKINNKYNGNVFTDVHGTLSADHATVSLSVASIDRMLIPSFKFSDADDALGARAYVDGRRQVSKQSIVDFRKPVVYTLAYPNQEQIVGKIIRPAVSGGVQETVTPLTLKAENLSSNYPSVVSQEGLGNLVDNRSDTYYHSYWNTGSTPLDESIVNYVDIALPEALQAFQIGYITRESRGNNMPSEITLLGSNDGSTWSEIKKLTAADGIPQLGAAQTFRSATIKADRPFRHLRFRCDKSTRRNYLYLAELNVYRVTTTHQNGQKARMEWSTEPYGRKTTVTALFPSKTAGRVPRIDITLHDNVTLQDIHEAKDVYRRATIKIDGAGVWGDLQEEGAMKGRGNSTWQLRKKPYRLKFDTGVKPFGLTKGKSWVLLANALASNSQQGGHAHFNNAIALKAAQLVGTSFPNHIVPVDLYVNGQYEGAYNFTEQVGISNNSVDLPSDSTGVLLELDKYDRMPGFEHSYDMPTSYKDPDQESYEKDFGAEAYQKFDIAARKHFNDFTAAVHSQSGFEERFDINSYVSYLFVSDLIGNLEFRHPKSVYVHCGDVFNSDSLWKFGPVWDSDWAYGYESTYGYAIYSPEFNVFETYGPKTAGLQFFKTIFDNSEKVRAAYYNLWYRFVNDGGLEALTAFIDDYHDFGSPSWKADYDLWSKRSTNYSINGTDDYAPLRDLFKSWLTRRARHVLAHLEVFPLVPPTAIADARSDFATDSAADSRTPSSEAVRRGIYTLSGTRVDLPSRQLPPGVYIIDGRKAVVR